MGLRLDRRPPLRSAGGKSDSQGSDAAEHIPGIIKADRVRSRVVQVGAIGCACRARRSRETCRRPLSRQNGVTLSQTARTIHNRRERLPD